MPDSPELFADTRDKSVSTLFLLPSLECDFHVSSLEPRHSGYLAPAYAASLFLTGERGLPLDELVADTPDGACFIKKLGNSGKYGLVMPKCRFLYTKTAIFDGDIHLRASCVKILNHTVCIVDTLDATMVSDTVMKRLLLSDCGENISASAAVSFNGEGLFAKAAYLDPSDRALPHLLACALASRHFLRCGASILKINLGGSEFHFAHTDGEVIAIEQNPVLLTLHAPDFQ